MISPHAAHTWTAALFACYAHSTVVLKNINDEGKRRFVEDVISAAPLTPEALSGLLEIAGPRGCVAIQGIAKDLRPYSKDGTVVKVYGRLVLDGFSIRIATSPQAAPKEGEAVIVKGSLTIRPTRPEYDWRATHEVMLTVTCLGKFPPV